MEDSKDREKYNIKFSEKLKWKGTLKNLWSMAGFIFALNFKNSCVGYHEVSQPQDSNLN